MQSRNRLLMPSTEIVLDIYGHIGKIKDLNERNPSHYFGML